jgi:hypothetical protein
MVTLQSGAMSADGNSSHHTGLDPMTHNTPAGFILQRSPSPINGAPIVVILTLNSANRKTGNMAQVWILREDINPIEADKTGGDISVCGNCPHRRNPTTKKRSCYVNLGQAPLAVWKAYKAGKYAEDFRWNQRHLITGRKIRWGAYGDPAMIDPQIFHAINGLAAGHTGYTHQWREPWAQVYRGEFMASCDGMRDYLEASAHGWKCFSVAAVGHQGPGKICPATVEGSQAQCVTCSLCSGDKSDIWVEAHGTGKAYVK